MRTLWGRLVGAAALAGMIVLAAAAAAAAAPVEGPAGAAFYTPPTPTPSGSAGELVWYRPATLNLNVTLPGNHAWTVLYESTGQQGERDWVTGTVIVPTTAWTGHGTRPVVTIGIGTQGIAPQCAPSKQMLAGTEYAGAEIIEALKAGYAVDVSDYQGYTNGAVPTYTAGRAEGQAVLDVVRAARQLPGAGLSSGDPTIAWGYSQGGQAVGWAGEVQSTYAPDVPLIGVAAGGVPANLKALGPFATGSVGSGFGVISAIGLESAYPGLSVGTLTAAGEKAVGDALSECAIELLATLRGANFSELTTSHESLEQLETHNAALKQAIAEQSLNAKPVSAPVYHYHGLEDELVPVKQDVELHYAWCALGVTDDFQLYPGEHLLTSPTAASAALKWIEERVAGRTAPSTCGKHTSSSTLPAKARLTPETGDLIVTLPEWQLKGKVTEAKSGLVQEIPAGATINAEADDTKGTLTATLNIPPINQTFWVGLVPVTLSGALTPTGPATGSFSLSNTGLLSESADGKANEEVKAVSIGFFTLPIGCKTVEPIDLPLSISEPANALATGGFTFSAKVTVPEFGECGLFGPLISAATSGPGNTVEMSAAPPPPLAW